LKAARSRRVNSSVRLRALTLKYERRTCLLLTARGSVQIRVNVSLSGCAAALRGIFEAGSRRLNASYDGGQRTVHDFNQRAAEQLIAAERHQRACHPQDSDAARNASRPLNSGVRLLLFLAGRVRILP
jgi:hypothetical protein